MYFYQTKYFKFITILISTHPLLLLILFMNTNEQLDSRISLLNEYSLCLERENESKSKEIATLHTHLQLVAKENQSLRNIISELRNKLLQRDQSLSLPQSTQQISPYNEQKTKTCLFDAESQTDAEFIDGINHLKSQIQSLKELIRQKQAKIYKYQSECEQMYEGIEKLQRCLADQQTQHKNDTQSIRKLEDKLRVEEKRRMVAEKRYEEASQTISSVDEENYAVREHIFNLESEISELVIENNRLIERTRQLEKEKNDYYHELKKVSRVSFGTENLGNSSFKRGPKVKDQRWREIEANLRKLQQENQAIQSNLMINR